MGTYGHFNTHTHTCLVSAISWQWSHVSIIGDKTTLVGVISSNCLLVLSLLIVSLPRKGDIHRPDFLTQVFVGKFRVLILRFRFAKDWTFEILRFIRGWSIWCMGMVKGLYGLMVMRIEGLWPGDRIPSIFPRKRRTKGTLEQYLQLHWQPLGTLWCGEMSRKDKQTNKLHNRLYWTNGTGNL